MDLNITGFNIDYFLNQLFIAVLIKLLEIALSLLYKVQYEFWTLLIEGSFRILGLAQGVLKPGQINAMVFPAFYVFNGDLFFQDDLCVWWEGPIDISDAPEGFGVCYFLFLIQTQTGIFLILLVCCGSFKIAKIAVSEGDEEEVLFLDVSELIGDCTDDRPTPLLRAGTDSDVVVLFCTHDH